MDSGLGPSMRADAAIAIYPSSCRESGGMWVRGPEQRKRPGRMAAYTVVACNGVDGSVPKPSLPVEKGR